MIYTIGNTKNYNTYLKEIPNLKKKGRDRDYQGGSVFKTLEDAENYLDDLELNNEYSVYGVEADWDKDTDTSLDGSTRYRDLLIDSKIIKI